MNKFSIIIAICLLLFAQMLVAQNKKLRVAVFDPTISGQSFDEGTGVIVRELVSTSLVETGKYTIIERSLIDKILKEQKLGLTDAFDESQVSAVGKLVGANKVILCVLSSYNDKGMLSLKMIDVESASIESQKSKLVKHKEILDVITPLTFNLIGEEQTESFAEDKKSNKNSGGNAVDAVKIGIGALFGGGNEEKRPEKKSQKEQFAGRMNKEEGMDFSTSSSQKPLQGQNILIEFKGAKNSKNPEAQVFIDDVSIGYGTLNEGFSLNFTDNHQGEHTLRFEWSSFVPAKTFKINTRTKRHYIFEYVKGGFGYEFKMSN